MLQLEPSQLQLPTMHSSSSPAFILARTQAGWPSSSPIEAKYTRMFEIFGTCPQADIHTHRNNSFKCVTQTGPPDLKTSLSLDFFDCKFDNAYVRS